MEDAMPPGTFDDIEPLPADEPNQDPVAANADEDDTSNILATFNKETWNLDEMMYGLTGLMGIRKAMLPIPKPDELFHLKFLVCPSGQADAENSDGGQHSNRRPNIRNDKKKNTNKDIQKPAPKGRYVVRHGRTEIVEGTGRGQWWRNIGSDDMDVLIREEISLTSRELFTVPPGHFIQQAGPAEVFVSGQAAGLTRMPVLPRGWATVDASAVGGPKYLEPLRIPKWQVVFTSGSHRGDIVVRGGLSLESDEVAMLFSGTIVEQSGPQEVEDGLIRMPISFAEPSGSSKAPRNQHGWVTCDATSQGGPRFFAPLAADDEPEEFPAPLELNLPATRLESALVMPPEGGGKGGGGCGGKGGGRGGGGGGGGRGRAVGSSWDKNRIWRVVNLPEDGSRLLAVVRMPEPYAPDREKFPEDENVVKWLANGELVEQVGHSKKSRGYMVMPIRFEVRLGGEASVGGEADGWVTRRLVDRDRETTGGSWFEEIRPDGRVVERDRRPQNFNSRRTEDPGLGPDRPAGQQEESGRM